MLCFSEEGFLVTHWDGALLNCIFIVLQLDIFFNWIICQTIHFPPHVIFWRLGVPRSCSSIWAWDRNRQLGGDQFRWNWTIIQKQIQAQKDKYKIRKIQKCWASHGNRGLTEESGAGQELDHFKKYSSANTELKPTEIQIDMRTKIST